MKKFIYIIIAIVGCLSAQAQQYYSKMFDVNGQWEDFSAVVDTSNKSYILLGLQVAFLVNDSSKFQSLFIGGLDSNFVFHQKLLIAKNYQSINYMTHYKNNNENYLITSTLDSNLAVNYILNELSKTFDTIKWNKKLAIPTNFYSQAWLKTKDKIYCFGRNGQYSLSAIPGFYAINLKDTSTQYYRIGGTGKIIIELRNTDDGNFLVAGLQYKGINGNDSAFGWYAKIDTLGNTIWEKLLNVNEARTPFKVGKTNFWFVESSEKTWVENKGYTYINKSYLAKTDELGNTIWKKGLYESEVLITSYAAYDSYTSPVIRNGYIYSLSFLKEVWNETNYKDYIHFSKLDTMGNILWNRRFSQSKQSNRFYSLTPVADGFLICADGKDSTRAKGDADAWLIKTDTNGCIIPGCNAKDGIVQIVNPERILNVYPNPAQNVINIETNSDKGNYQSAKLSKFFVYNLQGQILLTQTANNQNVDSINTENLSNGTYLIVIELIDGSQAVKKVLISK
jgi:hypothetical protein